MGNKNKNEIWFDEPYYLIGFNSKFAGKKYAKETNQVFCKTSEVSEEQAQKFMMCSDAGYIFSMDSAYYGSAKRALKDALQTKYFVITELG